MQIFLPYPDFESSAGVFSYTTMMDQCTAILRTLNTLHDVEGTEDMRQTDERVLEMWETYEPQLCEYALVLVAEWERRNMLGSYREQFERHLEWATSGDFVMQKPEWFGDPTLHMSHKAALIRMEPDFYAPLFPGVDQNMQMVWP